MSKPLGDNGSEDGRRVALELGAVLADNDLWAAIDPPYGESWRPAAMAERALRLYDLTGPILEARVDEFAEPMDYALGALRDLADAFAIFARRWSDEERANLLVTSARAMVEGVVHLYDLSGWAASMGVELSLTGAHAEIAAAKGPDEPGPDGFPSAELAASWTRVLRAFLQAAHVRLGDEGRADIQAPEVREVASGLIALGRGWLTAARQSEEESMIAVGVTQLLAAQGVFIAAWEHDRRSELLPSEKYLREFLELTGGREWLADHGAEVLPSLSR